MKGTHHQGAHHIVPWPVYAKTLAALIFLMGLTILASYWVAPSIHLGPINIDGSYINNGVALTIAVLKALLVISFFMGVKQASDLVKLWAMLGFIWFTLMFIILNDYGTRKFEPVPGWSKDDPGSSMHRIIDRGPDNPDPQTMVHGRP